MIFTPTIPLADVIHENYHLLPIINRFGIQLGFGSKSVAEVCSEKGITVEFFLEILNAYNSKDFSPPAVLQNFSVKLIIDYLSNTHHYFLSAKIPEIGELIADLLGGSSSANREKVLLVQKFFDEYRHELEVHTFLEDDDVYPYSLWIEQEFLSGNPSAKCIDHIHSNSINKYAQEHSNVDEKLFDLKNIIIKYLPPLENCNLQNSILYGLFSLEKDMKAHVAIENKVLVPRVQQMERLLLKMSDRG